MVAREDGVAPRDRLMPQSFPNRMIVLGASNVRRARVPLAKIFLQCFPAPVDLVFACGHGRSFVKTSRVLGWQLPGLIDAAWYERLRQYPAQRTFAMITDVGNDLFYRRTPEEILSSVERCIYRLGTIDHGVLIGPPMDRLRQLRPSEFAKLRSMFFPRSSLQLSEAMQGAERIAEGLEAIAANLGFSHVKPDLQWYGWDPIHVRWRQRFSFWANIVADYLPMLGWDRNTRRNEGRETVRWNASDLLSMCLARSYNQRWLLFDRSAPQPWRVRPDGTSVSFF